MTNIAIIPPAQPTPRLVADARLVVTNPDLYADRPILRRLAWATLLAARRAGCCQT